MKSISLLSAECYVQEEGDTVRIGNSLIERVLSREGGKLRTVEMVNKRTGHTWAIATRTEARLTLATASARIEIPEWRYMPGTREQVSPSQDEGFGKGYHRPELDDRAWQLVESLYSPGEGTDPVWPGYGWFRAMFRLPTDGGGQPVAFNLGGYDNEDWQFYRVFVNGEEVGIRELSGRWRGPAPFVLEPEHPAYATLRFGSDNVLAVQAGHMDKLLPHMDRAERQRYFFRSRLVDQFITVGMAATEVSDFRLIDYWPDNLGSRRPIVPEVNDYRPKDWAAGGDRDWMWCTFWTENKTEKIQVIHHYQVRSGEPIVRKKVEIRNLGDSPRLLLDVDVEDFRLEGATTDGGQGFPILVDDEAFCALEHPAGVNQGLGDGIRLQHFPGVTLAHRQGIFSQEAIFGVTERGKAREGFHEYLRKKSRRQDRWVSVYDPAGLGGGYINPHDPLYDITEQIVLDSIEMLDTLRARGITFDYYIIDVGWQDHSSDLTWFNADKFPNGPRKILKRLDEMGVKFGLWFSTTYAPWSCGDYPPVQHCIGGTGSGYWGEDKICMAAEPYPSIFRNAVLHHIRENKVRALKLDMGRYYCNSTEHGHLPGKYSVEAQIDSMVETARIATRACPDLFVMWYWGHSSPFWLLYGDTVQDKGLHGESVEVANWPNPMYRSSASPNLDQAARYAEFLPPITRDSLGTWIGDMICWNRIGKDDWQDAWLLDLARGSLLNQPWGDLAMFDSEDVAFLAEWYEFMRDNWRLYLHSRPILGDPWKAEMYGYASGNGAHTVVTVNNPGFEAVQLSLRLDEQIGLQPSNRGFLVHQRYRRRGMLSPSKGTRFDYGDVVEFPLRSFEVVVLEVGEELDTSGWPTWEAPDVVDSLRIAVEGKNVSPKDIAISVTVPPSAASLVEGYVPRAMVGQFQLPTLNAPRTLALITRQTKDGVPWPHRENHVLMKLRARVGDQELEYQTVPRHWLQMGRGGSPWLLFRLPVDPVHNEQTLQFELAGLLPDEVTSQMEAWLYHEWWRSEP